MSQDEILQKLREDLKQAFDTAKCKKCGCLRDTLITLRNETAVLTVKEFEALRADIDRFLNGMEPIKYECLGYDPCYPAAAENRFHKSSEGVLSLPMVNRPSCAFEMRTDGEWPVVAGEYFVLDRHGSVAISTLASTDLPKKLARLSPKGLAIVGKTETENIGIEKVVKNIITNPCIQTLIAVGKEPKGHLSGQTLMALAANGVDGQMRVMGSPAKRPFLRNITADDVEHFRQRITVVDLIGCDDPERIAEEVEAHDQMRPCSCEVAWGLNAIMPSVPSIRAVPTQRPLKLDRVGYFVIIPQPEKGAIVVEHYDYHDRLHHIIEGEEAKTLCDTIIELGLVSQLDHAAYLGRELMRAELSLRFGFPFVQDGA